jgi:hypothetical protein
MGAASNHTKYVTELAVLSAFIFDDDSIKINSYKDFTKHINISKLKDSDKVLSDLEKALLIGLANKKLIGSFNRIRTNFILEREKIFRHLEENKMPLPVLFDWQGDENQNDNDTPADVLWVDHPINGVSVKTYGGLNMLNLGIKELGLISHDTNAYDILSNNNYSKFFKIVVKDCLTETKINNEVVPIKEKYKIQYVGDNNFLIYVDGKVSKYSEQDLLNDNFSNQGHKRVFGDYFQKNKKQYSQHLENLTSTMHNNVSSLLEERVFTNNKLKMNCGAFCTKEYFLYETDQNNSYLVPESKDVDIDVSINNSKTIRFTGSGIKTPINIKNNKDNSVTTIEFWIRNHTGTFCGNPVNMIQGIRNKENIWQKI